MDIFDRIPQTWLMLLNLRSPEPQKQTDCRPSSDLTCGGVLSCFAILTRSAMHCLPISSTARLRVLAGKKFRSSVQNLRPTKSDDHLAGGGVLQPRSSIRCEKWTLRMKLDVQIKESLDFTLYDPIALLEPCEVSRKGLGKHLLKHPKRKSLDLGISTLRICFHEPRFVSSNHFHKTIECNWYKWGTNLYILYIPNLI